MQRLLYKQNDIFWLPKGMSADVETYLSDEFPSMEFSVSSYAIVFKNKNILQTDLCEGERTARGLDIPGGHIDVGETAEESVIRETYEETGVLVKNPKLVAYKKITILTQKPENYRYPYPTSYMLYFLCEIEREDSFVANKETHGPVWLPLDEYKKSEWLTLDKAMIDEIYKSI